MVDWIKCVQMHGPTNPKDISTSSLMWIRRLGIVTNRFSRVGSSIYIELTSVLFVLGRRLWRSTWMFAKQFGITWIVFWLAESPSDHYSTPLSMGGEFWWKEETFRPLKRNTQRTKIPVSSPTARQYFQWMVADWLLDTCAFFFFWTSDQLVAETSAWQHTTLTRDKHPCPRRDSNPQSQQAKGRRPTPLIARPPGSAYVSCYPF